MTLRFKYVLIKHPYTDEASSRYEKWAQIKLIVVDDRSQLIKVVFDMQWNIIAFLDWVAENKESIINEKIPLEGKGETSIAKRIFEFYDNLDPDADSEKIIDMLYSYRQRHGIRFALRGTDVDDVYIGSVDNVVTISYYSDNDTHWNFDIVIDDFIKDVENASLEVSK